MNYGRYFRLNQALSKVVSGVAIYDYIDLPAYFGPSVDNPMSPKYPINVTITSDSVCFRLHYSAFKIDEKENFDQILFNDGKKLKIEKSFPHYAYDKDDIDDKSLPKVDNMSLMDISMAHMEEIILELPFAQVSSKKLSDTIKNIYNTTFPQVVDENTSMGGRYLEQLIRKRYSLNNEQFGGYSIENDLYKRMCEVTDNIASYSTLWLMDLMKDGRISLYKKTGDKSHNLQIVGFLRKLLLDFMFDLKHSDVFQNSAYYQKMYSGLMSDFYFSALIHKCEYYYYRKITRQAIDDNEEVDDTIPKEENDKRIGKGKKSITALYANELVKAEDLWIKDIMNPLAEKEFGHRYPGIHNLLREYFEYYSFKQWPSWFAEPEEEMRRVCFSMKDKDGERHICNADTLVRYLKLKSESGDAVIDKMVELRNDGKERISKWFLKQYAFSDVLHLHLFKYANFLLLVLFAIPILASLFWRKKLKEQYFDYLLQESVLIIAIIVLPIACYWIWNTIKYRTDKNHEEKKTKRRFSPIVITRLEIIAEKVTWVILCIISVIFVIAKEYEWDRIPTISIWYSLFVPVSFVAYSSYKRRGFKGVLPDIIRDMISCLHLFLPRLVASITLAWITLSMGFDLYVSYFDAPPRTGYIIGICVIVTLFVMYSINLVIPHSPPLRKLLRSIELMIVSYFISLSVGFVVINFLGPKYLERGGFINEYYTHYVENDSCWDVHFYSNTKINGKDTVIVSRGGKAIVKDSDFKSQVDSLRNVYLTTCDKTIPDSIREPIQQHKVAAIISIWGEDFFILRDFLVMFSFIAMFTGIFIQLIIFGDNKQMTEL